MSRRGGKRKHIVQLGSNSSKLHRYGYSKQLHSGEVPKLIGDYPDSDSEEEEGLDGTNGIPTENVLPATSADEVMQGVSHEKDKGPEDNMDDELRNFLSEIEAIPMPPENGQSQSTGSRGPSPTEMPAQNDKEEDQDICKSTQDKNGAEQAISQSRKPKQYAMFVRGDTEFVPSPSQPAVADEPEKNEDHDGLDELPDEPVSQWQMVQDETTQYYYYWNYLTNQVTWEIPTEYTQYLLLHKEYMDKIAKYTPEQLQALKDKKAAKGTNARDTPVQGPHNQSVPTAQKDDLASHQSLAEQNLNLEETSRQRHERKKKKKKHKRKYSDDDGSDNEHSRSHHSSRKKEIGPEPKPPSPKTSVATAGSLLSIVAYASDNDDEEEEDNEAEKKEIDGVPQFSSTSDLPILDDQSVSETKDTPVTEESTDGKMPDLSAPQTPQLSPQASMPDLSPASVPGPDTDVATVSDSAVIMPILQEGEPTAESPHIPELDQGDDAEGCDPSGDDKDVHSGTKESESLGVDIAMDNEQSASLESKAVVKEEVLNEEQDTNVAENNDSIDIAGQGITDQGVEEASQKEKKKKKKEVIDMFAEDFPIVEDPPVDEKESVLVKSEEVPMEVESAKQPEVAEEGEIVDKKVVEEPEKEKQKDKHKSEKSKSKHNENLPLVSTQQPDDKFNEISTKTIPASSMSILASYGTDDEDEEGEVKEKSSPKAKKKKKDKKKDSKRKRSEEKSSKSSTQSESKSRTKVGAEPETSASLPRSDESSKKGTEITSKVQRESVEDTSVDIDPDDIDDIDRALEQALEKKLERKMVELDSYNKLSTGTSKEASPASLQNEEHSLHNGQAVPSKVQDDAEDATAGQNMESEAVKAEVKDMAELALNKLEFLDINTDGLSRLQVLFIELQTRLSDWTSGGLSTAFFLQKLQVAEGLLDQYEASAVPEGWACQWDRYDTLGYLLVDTVHTIFYTP